MKPGLRSAGQTEIILPPEDTGSPHTKFPRVLAEGVSAVIRERKRSGRQGWANCRLLGSGRGRSGAEVCPDAGRGRRHSRHRAGLPGKRLCRLGRFSRRISCLFAVLLASSEKNAASLFAARTAGGMPAAVSPGEPNNAGCSPGNVGVYHCIVAG